MIHVDEHEIRVYDETGAQLVYGGRDGDQISADRGWTPHVQGTITIATPVDDTSTQPGQLLVIEVTQRFGSFALTSDLTAMFGGGTTADLTAAFGGGTTADITALVTAGSWVTPVRAATGRRFELVITKRTRTRDAHTLELASREVLFQDWLWYEVDGNLEGVPLTFTADTVNRFLERILDAHRLATPLWVSAGGYSETFPVLLNQGSIVAIEPTTHTVETGAGTFAALQDLLTQARQRIYSPGDNTVRLVDYPYTSPGSIDVEDGVNLIDWEITDERARKIMVRFAGSYTDPDARPVYSSAAALDNKPPHEQLIDANHKPTYPKGIVTPLWKPSDPFLDRVGLDLSPIRLTVVNDYSVMPGSPITYTLPGEAEETDTIDAITWQLGGRYEMTIHV